jgi:hypothetical protein
MRLLHFIKRRYYEEASGEPFSGFDMLPFVAMPLENKVSESNTEPAPHVLENKKRKGQKKLKYIFGKTL